MTIPSAYRQLTKDEITQSFYGQWTPTSYVELFHINETATELIYAGESSLFVEWSDYKGKGKGTRKLKPHEPRTLGRICPKVVENWYLYSPEHISANGDIYADSYGTGCLMRIYGPEGTGPTAAEASLSFPAAPPPYQPKKHAPNPNGINLDIDVEEFKRRAEATNAAATDFMQSPEFALLMGGAKQAGGNNATTYIVQSSPISRCPQCANQLDLLLHQDGFNGMPAFSICWNCRWIGQIDGGPVERL